MLAIGAPCAVAQDAIVQRGGRVELGLHAMLVGPSRLGNSPANLTRPDGNLFTLFNTTNGMALGTGAEVHLGVRIARSLSIEGTAGWSRSRLESRITRDAEGGADVTVSETIARFTGEGSALWTFGAGGRTAFFVRGGAGWMRELAGNGTYHARGLIGNAGVGVKYWRRTSPGPGRRGLGLRLEGRASIRSDGISLGTPVIVVAPVISGGILFGF